MQRNGTSERSPSQPKGGQPRGANEDHDEPAQDDAVPNFLTARELQAREPAKGTARNDVVADEDEDEDEDAGKRKPGNKPAPR